MRKILFSFILSLSCFIGYGQFVPQSIGGTPAVKSTVRGAFKADSSIAATRYADTAAANRGANLKKEDGLFIIVGDTLFFRHVAKSRWIKIPPFNSTGGINYYVDSSITNYNSFITNYIDSITNINTYYAGGSCQSRLLSGSLINVGGFTFQNTDLVIEIGCKQFGVPSSIFNIAGPASTNIFVNVWADSLGNMGYTVGPTVPAPGIPGLDHPGSQVLIATFLIEPGSSTPHGIGNYGIYFEGSEWALLAVANLPGIDPLHSATPPYQGTKSLFIPANTGGWTNAFTFQGPDTSTQNMTIFNFQIFLTDTIAPGSAIAIAFTQGGYYSFVSDYVYLSDGMYGLDYKKTGVWQAVAIQRYRWHFSSPVISGVYVGLTGTFPDMKIDNMVWQTGGVNTGAPYVRPPLIDSVAVSGDKLTYLFYDSYTGVLMDAQPTFRTETTYDTCHLVTTTDSIHYHVITNPFCKGAGGSGGNDSAYVRMRTAPDSSYIVFDHTAASGMAPDTLRNAGAGTSGLTQTDTALIRTIIHDSVPNLQRVTDVGKLTTNWIKLDSNIRLWNGAARRPLDIGIGDSALSANTTADNNIAIGSKALKKVTTSPGNVALGNNVMGNMVTNTGYNTGVGDQALAAQTSGNGSNTAYGAYALTANTTGYYNTGVGVAAMVSNITGYWNTAVGASAMRYNTTGDHNTAMGLSSMYANTTGVYNTSFGTHSLYNNLTGNYNMAVGSRSLYNNTAGSSNTAIGEGAGYGQYGSKNVMIGSDAMYYAPFAGGGTSDSSTAVGFNAMYSSYTGTNNIAIGFKSAFGLSTGRRNVIIGSNTTVSANLNNNIILADGSGIIKFQADSLGRWKMSPGYGTNAFTGTAAYGLAVDASNNVVTVALSGGGGGSYTVTKQFHTSGTSVTIASSTAPNIRLIVNPASLLGTLAITLPTTPVDDQIVDIDFGGTITSGNEVVTALTIVGTVIQETTPDLITAGGHIRYRWEQSISKWYRNN